MLKSNILKKCHFQNSMHVKKKLKVKKEKHAIGFITFSKKCKKKKEKFVCMISIEQA